MKTNIAKSLLCIAALTLAAVHSAKAAFVITLQQSGGLIVGTGTGSLNTTGFSGPNSNTGDGGRISAQVALLQLGPANTTDQYYSGNGISGLASFGTGGTLSLVTSSGPVVGVFALAGTIYAPNRLCFRHHNF